MIKTAKTIKMKKQTTEYNPDQMDLFDDSNFRNTLDYSKEEVEDISLSYYAKESKQYRNSEGWDD